MRLLGRNLSLVAGDIHLATSLSRDLEVAKQSSSVLQGESPPPPPSSSQSGVSSPSKHVAAAPEDVPADDVPACRRCSKMFLQTMFLQRMFLQMMCLQRMFLQTMFLHTLVVGGAQHPLLIFPKVFSAVNAGSYQTVLTRSS